MENALINQNSLVSFVMRAKGEMEIIVKGTSMEPLLFENDIIHIISGEYKIGDILLFKYKYNELLVHRYVGIIGNRLLCKGDNSFRLEDIDMSDVLGKVDFIKRNYEVYKILHFPDALIEMSREIGTLFKKNKYNPDVTKMEPLYKEFSIAIQEYVRSRI